MTDEVSGADPPLVWAVSLNCTNTIFKGRYDQIVAFFSFDLFFKADVGGDTTSEVGS